MILVYNYQAFTGLMIYSITYKSISLYKLYVKKSLQVSNYIKMKFFFSISFAMSRHNNNNNNNNNNNERP